MRISTFLVAVISVAALTSCAPTREEYETIHVTFQGSPAIVKEAVDDCRARSFTAQEIKDFAALMNVSQSRVRPVFCKRFAGGIASGRITYNDIKALYANRSTPNMIKVLQGR